VEVIGPNHVTRNPTPVSPGLLLALKVAIADVSEAEQAIFAIALAENLGDGAADGAEAHQGDSACGRVRGGFRGSLSQRLLSHRETFPFIIRGARAFRELQTGTLVAEHERTPAD
jgi:hypothetical protein